MSKSVSGSSNWIHINDGYYALLACILTEIDPENAIRSICNHQPLDPQTAIIECREKHPDYTMTQIAERLNLDLSYVKVVLRDHENHVEIRRHYDWIDLNLLKTLVTGMGKATNAISREMGFHKLYIQKLLHSKGQVRRAYRKRMEEYFGLEEGGLLTTNTMGRLSA